MSAYPKRKNELLRLVFIGTTRVKVSGSGQRAGKELSELERDAWLDCTLHSALCTLHWVTV